MNVYGVIIGKALYEKTIDLEEVLEVTKLILGAHIVCLLKCSDLIMLLQEECLLTFDEIERLARLFISMGVNKIRLTGGEPLLRKDLPKLIGRLAKLEGLKDIGLTTNEFI